jgi:Tfp pilus assembly protein PilF
MRTQIVVLLWVVLLVALPPSFSQSTPSRQQQIEAHNHQAAEYLHQNRPDLAVPEFRAIVALDPNNVDAHGNLGAVLYFRGSYAEAIPELRAALKLRPSLWKLQSTTSADSAAGTVG